MPILNLYVFLLTKKFLKKMINLNEIISKLIKLVLKMLIQIKKSLKKWLLEIFNTFKYFYTSLMFHKKIKKLSKFLLKCK